MGQFSLSDERAANAIDKRLGQRVRTRRLEIGMSQEKLADLLGVTFQQVQKYEKGVNRMAASRLFDVAAALDLPIARFFEGSANKAKAETLAGDSIDDMPATPEGVELMRLFASIRNGKLRRRILDLVRAMTDGG